MAGPDDRQKSRKQAFEKNMEDLITAIGMMISGKLQLPALVLTYTAIDILGAIDSHDGRASAGSFKQWADKYLLAGSSLQCQSGDLYGARCGLLHTYSAQSDLSRIGRVKQIWYSWGAKTPEELQALLTSAGIDDSIVTVRVEDLFCALANGLRRFLTDLEQDPDKAGHIYTRAGLFLGNMAPPSRGSDPGIQGDPHQ